MMKTKKIPRIIALFFIFLAVISLSFGDSDSSLDDDLKNDIQLYYSLDDDDLDGSGNPLDLTPNNNDGTNNGATTGVTGIINQSFDFEDSNHDNVDTSYSIPSGQDKITISTWVNPNNVNNYGSIINDRDRSTRAIELNRNDGTGNFRIDLKTDSNGRVGVNSGVQVNGRDWTLVTVTYDGSDLKIYIDGSLENSASQFGNIVVTNENLHLGIQARDNSYPWNGKIDELAIWNKALTSTEIQELYDRQVNEFKGAQYPFISEFKFENIKANFSGTGFKENWNNTGSNTSDIDFQTTTNIQANHSYSLDGGNYQQYGTDVTIRNLSVSPTEGYHNITFLAETSTGNETEYYEFFIDLTNPSLTDNIPNEINFFEFNTSDYISFSDNIEVDSCIATYELNSTENITANCSDEFLFTDNGDWDYTITVNDNVGGENTSTGTLTVDATPPNLEEKIPSEINSYNINFTQYINFSNSTQRQVDTCQVFVDYQDGNYNDTTLCNNSNYTFDYNGNYDFNVTVNDTAGLQNTSLGSIFVNPTQSFQFRDEARDFIIQDYSFGSFESTGDSVDIKTYELGLGTHTLEFEKKFYLKENITFDFTNTSPYLGPSHTNLQKREYNVTPVDLAVQVFDEQDLQQLVFNITFINSTDSITSYNNVFDFTEFSENLPRDGLEMLIEKKGYSTRKLFTNNAPYEALHFKVHLLNDTESTAVIFKTQEQSTRNPLEDVTLTFEKLVNGSYRYMGQARTDSQGLTYFNMDVLYDEGYRVMVRKEGYNTIRFNTISGKSEYSLLLTRETAQKEYVLKGLDFDIEPKDTFRKLPFNATATVIDSDNELSSLSFSVYGDNTNLTKTSTDPSGDTLNLKIQNFSYTYNMELNIYRNGELTTINRELNFYNVTTGNFTLNETASRFLSDEASSENRVVFMIVMFIVFAVMGAIIGGVAAGGALAPDVGAMFATIPLIIYSSVGFISPLVAGAIILTMVVGVLYFKS